MSSDSQTTIPDVFAQHPTDNIINVLKQFYNTTKNQPYKNKTSMYGRAAKHITNQESTLIERQFLYNLWTSYREVHIKFLQILLSFLSIFKVLNPFFLHF